MNTALFVFETDGPNVTSLGVQRWMRDELKLRPGDVIGIQREFATRRIFIKFKDGELCDKIVKINEGKLKYTCEDGTEINVEVSQAGLGYREIKVFNLPFEMPATKVASALAPYGKVIKVQCSKFGPDHIFPVDSGIRIVGIELTRHVPSFVYMGDTKVRATVVYDGQPRTCAICNETGHLRAECPTAAQRRLDRIRNNGRPLWTEIVDETAGDTGDDKADDAATAQRGDGIGGRADDGQADKQIVQQPASKQRDGPSSQPGGGGDPRQQPRGGVDNGTLSADKVGSLPNTSASGVAPTPPAGAPHPRPPGHDDDSSSSSRAGFGSNQNTKLSNIPAMNANSSPAVAGTNPSKIATAAVAQSSLLSTRLSKETLELMGVTLKQKLHKTNHQNESMEGVVHEQNKRKQEEDLRRSSRKARQN